MTSVRALSAQLLSDDERFAHRHRLLLSAQASADGDMASVVILNLSETGLLIESPLDLDLGDEVDVELPQAGTRRAEVVWRSEDFYGCQFASPVTGGTVSAARLRSPSSDGSPDLGPSSAIPHDQDALLTAADPSALSLRQKLGVITGLAVACWLPVILAVRLLI